MAELIAVDWGTSSLRSARLGADGVVVEERAFPRGILSVPKDGFAAVFDQCFGDWMTPPGTRSLIAHALRSPGLLQSAFSVRTLSLFDRLPMAERPSYLSGLAIGEELRSRPLERGAQLVVVGADALTRRYERALAQRGVRMRSVGTQAAWRGLWDIARTIDT